MPVQVSDAGWLERTSSWYGPESFQTPANQRHQESHQRRIRRLLISFNAPHLPNSVLAQAFAQTLFLDSHNRRELLSISL